MSEAELLGLAAALESRSSHPVARAVLRHASGLGVVPAQVEAAQARPGLGASGRIRGVTHHIGNLRFLEETGNVARTPELEEALARHGQSAGTMVLVWTAEKALGCLTVTDEVRPQAKAAVAELAGLGVDPVVMLTGDNAAAAAPIAREAGLTRYAADLMPEDKTRVVEELVASGRRVAMVGDGVNDAPALAAAHLGVAMGSIGTDAAIETADVALMSDDLSKLPWLIRHSRRTLRIIRANIWFALGLKAVFLVLAVLQMATLWTAILADLGASLAVIFNGLRLLRIKR
jgi:Cd2+/Zn2+-exporting ATPase